MLQLRLRERASWLVIATIGRGHGVRRDREPHRVDASRYSSSNFFADVPLRLMVGIVVMIFPLRGEQANAPHTII